MKRTLSLLLSLVLLFTAIPNFDLIVDAVNVDFEIKPSVENSILTPAPKATYSGSCGVNLSWSLNTSTGVLSITGTGDMYDFESYLGTPWYSYYRNITKVIISSGVTSIGDYAFNYCSSLTSITIPDSVTSIGKYAFADCDSITSLSIPNSVTCIAPGAFSCRSLTSITIPDSVTSIGEYAFSCCYSLTSITIPDSVTSIGGHAFRYCTSLTSITIPDSVASIGDNPFDSCSSLTSINVSVNNKYYSSEGGVLFNKNKTELIQYPAGKTKTYYWTMPFTVKKICNYAFSDNKYLKTITIRDSVTSIGEFAFADCDSLTSLSIPNSVTSIGEAAFIYCDSLTSISIPNSVTSIGDFSFYCCSSLESVSLPNSVTSIGEYAFASCDSLTSLSIPNSVTSIGEYAFYWCSSLTSITIGNSVTSIGECAFHSCTSLKSITIPDSVTSIGRFAFGGCTSLTSVSLPNSVTSIGSGAFDGCSSLQMAVLGNGVETVDDDAFKNCSSLKSIIIPKSLKSIGNGAFYGCDKLSLVSYVGSKTAWGRVSIGTNNEPLINAEKFFGEADPCGENLEWSFNEATGDLEIFGTGAMVNYDSALEVPWYEHRKSITKLIIQNGVTSVGSYAFADLPALKHVIVFKTVTSIGDYAFNGCDAFKYAYYSGSKEDWELITVGKNNAPLTNAEMYYAVESVTMSHEDVLPRYPKFSEEAYIVALEEWVNDSEYRDAFKAYLELGYTYKDLLYFTVDMPVMGSDGEAYSIESNIQVKDLMSYIMFAKEAQKFFDDTIEKVEDLIKENKSSQAYKEFFKAISSFNQQYINFQNELNGVDSFNKTLSSLLMAKTLLDTTKNVFVVTKDGTNGIYAEDSYEYQELLEKQQVVSSNLFSSVSYLQKINKATMVDSPTDYDSLEYYIKTGGDTSKLNPLYKDAVDGMGVLIKDAESLFNIVKKGELDNPSKYVSLAFDNLKYFADVYNMECADDIKMASEAWKNAKTAADLVKAMSGYSLLGVASAAYSLADTYIEKVKAVYESAEDEAAGWYALMFYYLTKENPKLLKDIVNPSTGSVVFDGGTGLATYGLSYDQNDVIERQIMLTWQKYWKSDYTYTPSTEYKLHLWDTGNTAVSIMNMDCKEYSRFTLEYLLAELGYETNNMGVGFDVSVSTNNSSYGTVSGGGNYTAGDEVTVKAVSLNNAPFLGWKNTATEEIVSTDKSYTFKVTGNVDLQAMFEAPEIVPAVVPTINLQPLSASYAKGQSASALTVSATSSDGGTISIDWYQATSATAVGTKVGSGASYTPAVSSEGTLYYYAKVTNTKNGTSAAKNSSRAKIEVTAAVMTDFVVVTPPTKTSYLVYEEFLAEGLTVALVYSDGTQTTVSDYVLDYDFSKAGSTQVNISCCGFTVTIDVTVSETVGGSFENGVNWEVNCAENTLTISGNGNIPSNASESFYDYTHYVHSIVISEGVTAIESFGLTDLVYARSLYLPDTLNYVGDCAFNNCISLSDLYINDIAKWCQIEFYDDYANPISHIKNLHINGEAVTEIVIPNSVSSISNYAFAYCPVITSVTVECANIGDYAFSGCVALSTLTLSRGVVSIGNFAFEGCVALENLSIPSSVTTVGVYAFSECIGIKNTYVSDNVSAIGEYAFAGCCSLESFDIPDSIVSLATGVLYNCTSLASICVPQSVTDFGEHAFEGCNNLTTIYYDGYKSMWYDISIGNFNDVLSLCTIFFAKTEDYFEFAEGVETDNIEVNTETGKIIFKLDGITVADALSMFENNGISITNANGVAVTNDGLVGTGCVVTSTIGKVAESRTVIVMGDIDGDGLISATDYAIIKKVIMGYAVPDNCYGEACDYSMDGFVSTVDLLAIKLKIGGL